MEKDIENIIIPAEAQSAEDIALPESAAERKRVLNILAQRRYREWITAWRPLQKSNLAKAAVVEKNKPPWDCSFRDPSPDQQPHYYHLRERPGTPPLKQDPLVVLLRRVVKTRALRTPSRYHTRMGRRGGR